MINDWANALRNKDAAGVVSLQTEDFVQFALAPPLRAEALDRDGLEDWFSSWEGPITYEVRDQTITTAEEVAFSHSLNRMRATTTDGEQTDLWFRQTLCFRKVGGEWRIAHEHDSVPFYMDNACAAIDARPDRQTEVSMLKTRASTPARRSTDLAKAKRLYAETLGVVRRDARRVPGRAALLQGAF